MEQQLLIALFYGIVGVALGGVLSAMIARYVTFKEAQGIAAGESEFDSMLHLIRLRDYPGWIDGIISRLKQADY